MLYVIFGVPSILFYVAMSMLQKDGSGTATMELPAGVNFRWGLQITLDQTEQEGGKPCWKWYLTVVEGSRDAENGAVAKVAHSSSA
jgi:hypothetical protein